MIAKTTASLTAVAAILLLGSVASRAQDTSGGGGGSQVSNEGKEVYENICQACHMADAKGASGAGATIPALAGNAHLADKDFIASILLTGRGGMPWFSDMLTNKQMAAVATYVRGHFNAYPDPVTEADLARLAETIKASPRDCKTC